VESRHGRLRDECLDGERRWTLTESRVVAKDYPSEYNLFRSHSKQGHRRPSDFAALRATPSPDPVTLWVPGAEDGQPHSNESTVLIKPED
jgi:hypothetical protein